jgi:hypothetical protein
MTLDGTTSGLWLVGVGSLLTAVPRLIRAPRPELGLSWESMARLVERIHAALETVGLVTVAIGSAVLAIAELGPWWFECAAVLVAIAAVYLVSAYKLRQLWLMRADTVQDEAAVPSSITAVEQRQLALDHARWQACLRRAFSRTPQWPPAPSASAGQAVQPDKLKPRHITELHERDERLADMHIPPAIRHDVYAIRAHGFHVNVVGDVIVATAPDGQVVQVPFSSLEGKFGPVLGRQKFLEDLRKVGLPVHPGSKGRPHVDP